MKKQTVLTFAASAVAVGLAVGCVHFYQTNLDSEKALAEVRAEFETVQADLETALAECASLQEKLSNNVVTDQRDLFHTDNVVVDTPEQAQAEQSTQGAADKTQQQAPSGQQAIEDDLNKQIPEKTTPPKTDKLPDASSSQAQNPSEQDVNDYLNDILNGGGSGSKPSGGSTSKPSGGSSGTGWDNTIEARPGGADGALGGGGNVDDFNWD